jgi:hypothetical protein
MHASLPLVQRRERPLPDCRPGGGLRRAGLLGLLLLGLAGAGCEGAGVGQLSGTLFVRGCPVYDPTAPGSLEVPRPLPSYSLDPEYFFAEAEPGTRRTPSDDPPGVTRLKLRMQKSSHKAERTDVFELLVYDVDGLPALQAAALARGLAGVPIIPPPLDQTPVPPPPAPDSTVRAALRLNGNCPYPVVAPQLRGYVRFTEIGSQPGDMLAGEFTVSVEDLRAQREQGTPAPSVDVAGALVGSFRFPLRTGPASGAL